MMLRRSFAMAFVCAMGVACSNGASAPDSSESDSPPLTESESGRIVGQPVQVDSFTVEVTSEGSALFVMTGSVPSPCHEAFFGFEEPNADGVMIGESESWLDSECDAAVEPTGFSETMEINGLPPGDYMANLDAEFEVSFVIPTQTTSAPSTPFSPAPMELDGGRQLDLFFTDGSTMIMTWPSSLDLISEGIELSAWGALGELTSATARDIIIRFGSAASVRDQLGAGELLGTYPGSSSAEVEFWRFESWPEVDLLVFDFKAWTVLIPDPRGAGGMSEASRTDWSRRLEGNVVGAGFLTLTATPPLVLAEAGDQPQPIGMGLSSPDGNVTLVPGECDPEEPARVEGNYADWCDSSGLLRIRVSGPEAFRDAVRNDVGFADIRLRRS